MYLRRKIDQFLVQWHEDTCHLPLIVRGPRQIGKTESILHFARAHYTSVIEINFVESPVYQGIASGGYGVDDIVRNITLIDPSKELPEHDTLIFFDEVQEYPEIATSLKFFAQDGRYDVICSGSMLGINYKRIESNSVGYKIDYLMRSMDFEEFLWARGYSDNQIDAITGHMTSLQPFSTIEMDVFGSAFLDYCVLGGMPAVVSRFVESGNFIGTLDIQKQLITDYREDIQKYAEGLDKARVLNVFDHIPAQLAKENKKFQVGKVAKGARFKDYRGCVDWLKAAGLAEACYCLNYPELPLKGNYDQDKYKLYFSDNGLLVAMLDDEAAQDLRANKNLGVYKGALYESIAADALVRQGYGLYYYKKEDSTLEEDFFVRTADSLVPVEVKARNRRAKSLRTLVSSSSYPDIRFGLKFTDGNVGKNGEIYSFPHFCLFKLREFLASL
ncbi:MAG: ATP-binding protein [Coriobacteriales bacterium]